MSTEFGREIAGFGSIRRFPRDTSIPRRDSRAKQWDIAGLGNFYGEGIPSSLLAPGLKARTQQFRPTVEFADTPSAGAIPDPFVSHGMTARPLSDAEIKAIMDSFDGHYALRNRALLTLGLRCGGRVSAVLALRVGDMICHGRFVTRINFRRATVKGKKASYSLPLHPAAKWAVGRWLVIYRRMMGGKLDARQPLFPARTGRLLKPLSRWQAWRIISEAADCCRLDPGVSPHSWRKSLASRLFKATKSILVVKQILQHRNISTTVAYLNFALTEEAESALMRT